MNEVKRYHEFKNGVVENEHVMFVTHKDYAALQQQLTATTNSLTNAQEALKSAGIEADTVQAGVMELVSRMNQVAAENYDLKHPGTYLPSKRETPATDAYLNAVRAEVLENVPTVCDGKEQLAFEAYASSKGLDLSKHPLHYLFLDGKTNQARSAWRECLVYVAAQLLAGNAGKDGSHE